VTETSALIDEHLRPIALIGLGCATLGVVLVWWKPPKAAPWLLKLPPASSS
jgi:hypothetical protein